jgi:hypothetical protein
MRSLNTSSRSLERLADERDRPDLAAGDRRFGLVLGEAERAADAAGLGARHVAGDAVDLRVVVASTTILWSGRAA